MRWRDRRRPRVRLLVVLLVLTLVLSAGLGFHALDSARSHRAIAEQTLREYAGIAAWEFARRAREQLGSAAFLRLRAIERMDYQIREDQVPPVEVLASHSDDASCDCVGIKGIHTYFRLDLRSGTLTVTPNDLAPALRRSLADTLRYTIQQAPESRMGFLGFPLRSGRTTDIATYTTIRDRSGQSAAVFGFIAGFEGFEELFTRSCSQQTLLPATLAGNQPNDSLLFVSVFTPDSAQIYQSPVRYPDRYAASDTLGTEWAGLRVQAALRPDVAERLLIGGLPSSRLPLVFGMLLVTLGLGGAALHQIRRENELARLRDDFVSGVSHELRTPLAQIRMFSELLENGRLRTAEERDRSTQIIHREAKRLTHLVENILQFSRSRRHALKLSPVEMDVGDALRDLAEAFTPLAVSRGMRVAFETEGPVGAHADRDALCQIVLNLLDNAAKYGPAGQMISITVRGADDEVAIVIDDQGPGIPPRDRKAVFQQYRRLERDVAATTGSGIGLSVVQDLAEQQGGTVSVESAPGGGARFVVRLPRNVEHDGRRGASRQGRPGAIA